MGSGELTATDGIQIIVYPVIVIQDTVLVIVTRDILDTDAIRDAISAANVIETAIVSRTTPHHALCLKILVQKHCGNINYLCLIAFNNACSCRLCRCSCAGSHGEIVFKDSMGKCKATTSYSLSLITNI